MDEVQALKYFRQIKEIWAPFRERHRIIPFCTPVIHRPTALVIGTNHSDFAPDNPEAAATIADRFAEQLPTENTFLAHKHSFAIGLNASCAKADIVIDNTWMSTNRCAVQTDSTGLKDLKINPTFASCQKAMDALLKTFVAEVRPINLILAGAYAVDLYYVNRREEIDGLECLRLNVAHLQASINVIPIPHPSMAYHRKRIADRLRKHFVRAT